MRGNVELTLRPIGWVAVGRPWPDQGDPWEETEAEIAVADEWIDALKGIDEFSHIWVIWWLDRSAATQPTDPLRIRPERREEMPLVGIFATRSPHRPNPIGVTAVALLQVQGGRLRVRGLDAFQGTPVLDIKPYLRRGDLIPGAVMPEWLKRLWSIQDEGRGF